MTVNEKFRVSGSQVVDKIKKIIHEGNIRKLRLLHEGRTVIEIPLLVGAPAVLAGILITPVMAAIGAFTTLVTECTIVVERVRE